MSSSEASLRLHNLANETEHLSAHMDQVDDAVFLDLSVDPTKFAKAAVNIRLQVHVKKHLSKIESTRATIIAEKDDTKNEHIKEKFVFDLSGPDSIGSRQCMSSKEDGSNKSALLADPKLTPR